MRRIVLVMSAVALMAVMMVAMAAPAMATRGLTSSLTAQSTNPTTMDTNGLVHHLEQCYELAEKRGTNPENCDYEDSEQLVEDCIELAYIRGAMNNDADNCEFDGDYDNTNRR